MKVGLLLLKKLQGGRHHYLLSYLWAVGRAGAGQGRSGVGSALLCRAGVSPSAPQRHSCPAERCQCSAERAPRPHITGKERICGVLQSLECSCYLLPSADKCHTLFSHTQMHLPRFSRVFCALPVLSWDEDHTVTVPRV